MKATLQKPTRSPKLRAQCVILVETYDGRPVASYKTEDRTEEEAKQSVAMLKNSYPGHLVTVERRAV